MANTWRASILKALNERNQSQVDGYKSLITKYHSLLRKHTQLEKEYAAKLASHASGVGGASLDELNRSKEELTVCYKKMSENGAAILELNQNIKALNNQLADKDKQIAEWRAKFAQAEQETARFQHALQEKATAIQVLTEELKAIHIGLTKSEEAAEKLRADNQELVDRWLRKMNEEADRMNDANVFYSSLQQQQQQQQQQKQMPVPKGAELDTNVRGTMLDGGRSSVFSVQLPTRAQRTFQAHKGEINCVAHSSQGHLIASGSVDKSVRLWEAQSGKTLGTLSGPASSVLCVAFSPNDEFVLGTSSDNAVRLWSVQQQRVRHTLTGHLAKVTSAVFTRDSARVVTGSHDRSIRVWDLSRGYCIRTLFCLSACNDVVMTNDGNVFISAHRDNAIRFWDSRSNNNTAVRELTQRHQKPVASLQLNPGDGGRTLLSCGLDNELQLIDLSTYETLVTYRDQGFRNAKNGVTRAVFSPDGAYVTSGSQDGQVFFWQATTGHLDKVLSGSHSDVVSGVSWNPNGLQVTTCDKNGMIVNWEP